MNNDECAASLRVLLAMVRADGEIHQREREALDVLAKSTFGGDRPDSDSPPRSEAHAPCDVEAECAKITTEKGRRLTFSAALVLADIDETRSTEETALLARIHKALGHTGEVEPPLLTAAHRARMGLLTMKLADAQSEFLRGLSQLSKTGSIDAKEYERLLDELEQKKIALLKGSV